MTYRDFVLDQQAQQSMVVLNVLQAVARWSIYNKVAEALNLQPRASGVVVTTESSKIFKK